MAKRKPKFLTINQLLEFLGPNTINRMTIYKQIWAGNIPAKKNRKKIPYTDEMDRRRIW